MEEQPALISQPQEPLPARLNISLLFRVHGANKLAAKHDRVKLESAAEPVQCDICQDRPAVLFCSEDRALICRRYSCIHNLDCSSYCLKWGPGLEQRYRKMSCNCMGCRCLWYSMHS